LSQYLVKENPSIKALASYLLQKSASNPALHSTLQNLFSQSENHVGLVICERLINMPVQVIPPMYRMLKDELDTENNSPFKFTHLIIPSRTYHLSIEEESYLTNMKEAKSKKKKTKATAASATSRPTDGVYSFHPEDEHIQQASLHTVDYPFTATSPEPRNSESFGLDIRGRMMLVPFEKFEGLVEKMNETYAV
jgi:protein BCP1